jgi:protein-disulfide isomerase-like protein with CxxC motif
MGNSPTALATLRHVSRTAVLSKLAAAKGLKLKLTAEVAPEGGLSRQKIEETKAALRELGMSEDVNFQ